tara:strand:+ start:25 stop:180 length:156 start_codon:yes stop_codon:yes gene_type:complete
MNFEKLRKKIGIINPETLSLVINGEIELSREEQKEFEEFMNMGRKMFAPKK